MSTGKNPPYIHNLSRLAELSGLYGRMSDAQRDTLDALEPLNIQARYPEEKKLTSSTLNADRCRTILRETEELYRWIRAAL